MLYSLYTPTILSSCHNTSVSSYRYSTSTKWSLLSPDLPALWALRSSDKLCLIQPSNPSSPSRVGLLPRRRMPLHMLISRDSGRPFARTLRIMPRACARNLLAPMLVYGRYQLFLLPTCPHIYARSYMHLCTRYYAQTNLKNTMHMLSIFTKLTGLSRWLPPNQELCHLNRPGKSVWTIRWLDSRPWLP